MLVPILVLANFARLSEFFEVPGTEEGGGNRADAGRHCHSVWRHAQSGWIDKLVADKGTRRTASPTAWAMQNGPGNG